MIDIGKTPVKSVSRNMAEATARFVGDATGDDGADGYENCNDYTGYDDNNDGDAEYDLVKL